MKRTKGSPVKKNPAAVALGKLRAASMTTEDRQKASRGGGVARAESLSKSRRAEIAKKAAVARWEKAKKAAE